jgi:hypothetical protein
MESTTSGLPARKYEFIAIGIFEFCHRPPDLLLRLCRQFHPFGFEERGRGKDVVAPKGERLETANPVFVARRREQSKAGIGARDEQFDPALTRAKRLIGRYLESDLLGVKLQRYILVAHGNTDDFDSADHAFSSGVKFFSFAT